MHDVTPDIEIGGSVDDMSGAVSPHSLRDVGCHNKYARQGAVGTRQRRNAWVREFSCRAYAIVSMVGSSRKQQSFPRSPHKNDNALKIADNISSEPDRSKSKIIGRSVMRAVIYNSCSDRYGAM